MSTLIKKEGKWVRTAIGDASMSFVRKPAWSQAETIAALPFTAPKDGVLMLQVGALTVSQGGRTFYINSVEVAKFATGGANVSHMSTVSIPVNQGDILTSDYGIWGVYKFVPFEDSTIAEPEVVTPELIRNMNTPDYTKGQAVTLANTSASFTADKAYWVTYTNTYPLRVNGVTVSSLASSANVNSFAGRIERGDVLTVASGTAGDRNLVIYPYKAQ